jgi:MoaA/NifB/PqqE/SkfB family radical SAM enzyme
MTRKIYRDFLLRKARERQLGWVARAGGRYARILASQVLGRPLCGPVLATLVTNYSCNFHCEMCDMPRRGGEVAAQAWSELTTAGLAAVLDDLHALGALGVGFTGGEPLLRRDIFELLAHAHTLGMITHLNTNGSLLDEAAAAKILSAGVDSLNISVDGSRAATHDAIRGVPGAFEKACAAVRTVDRLRRKEGSAIRLKMVTVVSERNVDEIQAILALARDLGADCSEFIPRQPFLEPPAAGGDSAGGKPSAHLLDAARLLGEARDRGGMLENSAGMLRLFEPSFLGQPSPLRCFAGYNSIAVDNFGEIYPCLPWLNWGRSVGNVRDRPLTRFWYAPEYRAIREKTAQCRECYLNCQAELNLLFQPWRLLFAGKARQRQ